MKAVIFTNGLTVSRGKKSKDGPTPLKEVGSKPLLHWQLACLKDNGIDDIVLVVDPINKNLIKDEFAFGNALGVQLTYVDSDASLGTAGVLFHLAKFIHEDFLWIDGNLMFDLDFSRMLAFHESHPSTITVFAHPKPHPEEEDIYVVNKDEKVINVLPRKDKRNEYYDNLSPEGIFLISKDFLETFDGMDGPIEIDFNEEILLPTISCEGVYAYSSSEYVKSCSSSSRIAEVNRDQNNGIIHAKNLKNPQKAIFLDRDGVINHFGDYVTDASILEVFPFASKAIKAINDSGYLAIVITNQPVVARGDTSLAELHNIHAKMQDVLGLGGAYLDAIYVCPHFPEHVSERSVPELTIVCNCRKPKTGMIDQAKEKFNIDLSASYFIGDHYRDVKTANNAGIKSIHVLSGDLDYIGRFGDAKPDYVCENIVSAVDLILSKRS